MDGRGPPKKRLWISGGWDGETMMMPKRLWSQFFADYMWENYFDCKNNIDQVLLVLWGYNDLLAPLGYPPSVRPSGRPPVLWQRDCKKKHGKELERASRATPAIHPLISFYTISAVGFSSTFHTLRYMYVVSSFPLNWPLSPTSQPTSQPAILVELEPLLDPFFLSSHFSHFCEFSGTRWEKRGGRYGARKAARQRGEGLIVGADGKRVFLYQ